MVILKKITGVGLGYRPEFYDKALAAPDGAVDWYEVVSENFFGGGGRPRRFLHQCRERFPMAMHGVGLSIAGIAPANEAYLRKLKSLADDLKPAFISDHICWTSHLGFNTHDLLPVPYTHQRLLAMAETLGHVQDLLGRRFYLENPSAYVAFAENDYTEVEFILELIKRSGCGLLLDINNLYVNHKNLGLDAADYLGRLRADDICYIHLAGHSVGNGVLIDTHDHHVADDVWALYRFASRLFSPLPTLIEWDDNIPDFDVLTAEVEKARHHLERSLAGDSAPCFGSDVSPPVNLQKANDGQVYNIFYDLVTTGGERLAEGDQRLAILSSDTHSSRWVGAQVYAHAYFARLRDCLKAIFPTLAEVFSCGSFEEVARAYIQALPPEEPSISRVGARFANFLTEGAISGDFGVPRQVLADIARIEWAVEQLYDVPDTDALPLEALREIGAEEWEDVCFTLTNTWDLVPVSFAVKPVVLAVSDGALPQRPEARALTYVVYRLDEEIYWDEIPEEEAQFVSRLADGSSFLSATESLAATRGASIDVVVPDALEFLRSHVARAGVKTIYIPSGTELAGGA